MPRTVARARPVERSGSGDTSLSRVGSRSGWAADLRSRTARRFAPQCRKCGVSRTQAPEREGLGPGNPASNRSWLGNRNSLARSRALRRVPICRYFLVKGGNPLSRIPPKLRAANRVRFSLWARMGPAWNSTTRMALPAIVDNDRSHDRRHRLERAGSLARRASSGAASRRASRPPAGHRFRPDPPERGRRHRVSPGRPAGRPKRLAARSRKPKWSSTWRRRTGTGPAWTSRGPTSRTT